MARDGVLDARKFSVRGGGYRHGLCYELSVPTSTSPLSSNNYLFKLVFKSVCSVSVSVL